MYQFRDLTNTSSQMQSSSSYGIIFNGHDLETEVPGFLTLLVSGRGIVSHDLITVKAQGMDGVHFEETSLDPREIRVKYQIRTDDTQELRATYERLNKLLQAKRPVPIRFKDDPSFYYLGTLSGASEEEEVTNTQRGELIFFCPKPFKYQDYEPGAGASVTFPNGENAFGLIADFSFTPAASAPEVRIRNSLDQSVGIGPVVAGRKYDLVLSGERPSVYENGIRKMTLLSIEAGLESFKTAPGLSYSLSTGGVLTAVFKELRL